MPKALIRRSSWMPLFVTATSVLIASPSSLAQATPGQTPPAAPAAPPPAAAQPAPKPPSGAQVLLERRRADVARLEAAWNAKRAEVEGYLSDVVAWTGDEARKAEAAYYQARIEREVAEIVVIEYEQGIYMQDRQTVLREIALAQSDVTRASERLAWTEEATKRGNLPDGALVSERLTVEVVKFTLEQARTKLSVLEKYTMRKKSKELKSEVEIKPQSRA